MKRVTGIGGVFFKARDPETLRVWYRKYLGLEIQDWGGTTFRWQAAGDPSEAGTPGNGDDARTSAAATSATEAASEGSEIRDPIIDHERRFDTGSVGSIGRQEA